MRHRPRVPLPTAQETHTAVADAGMASHCSTFWKLFWDQALQSLSGETDESIMILRSNETIMQQVSRLTRVAEQMRHFDNHAYPAMITNLREHLQTKMDTLQMPTRKRHRTKGPDLAACSRPQFVQDTSLKAIVAASRDMEEVLMDMGIAADDFDHQSRKRQCDAKKIYLFADFVFWRWAGLDVQPFRLAGDAPKSSDSASESSSSADVVVGANAVAAAADALT